MDTLTVDQRDPVEVSSIVDVIPNIFRMAKKTIAVRECDGLYDCCMEAVEGFEDHGEFTQRLHDHASTHRDYACAESYLQRLWTLQECLLSDTIEFVVGRNSTSGDLVGESWLTKHPDQPKAHAVRLQSRGDFGFYRFHNELTTLSDSLWVLAFSIAGSEGKAAMVEFSKAYIHGGTVIKPKARLRSDKEDIHSGFFLKVNRASHRSATMPRDYIFATMPDFTWYKYPKEEALTMSFGEIYLDLYSQAARSGHAFTCKFTRLMPDATCTDPIDGWQPSPHLPSPTTLGDFLKMVGHRVPENPTANSQHVHITSVVQVEEFECRGSPDYFITVLESSLRASQEQWQESHIGREVSKYGNFPSLDWSLDSTDAILCGWFPTDPDFAVRMYKDSDVVRIGPGLDYREDDLLPDTLRDLDETEKDATEHEAGEDVPLFVQARKILDHMWCAKDPMQDNRGQRSDWESFKKLMRGSWSTPLLRTMLLLAAMINCRVPLSAAAWVNKLFVPVYIHHGTYLLTFGLPAKHARKSPTERRQPQPLLCVGQHYPSAESRNMSFGKDLFLVDPVSKVPIGLVSDLMPDERTDEMYAKVTRVLYNGFCEYLVNNQVKVAGCPLSSLQ
jgi:hypothetical protein